MKTNPVRAVLLCAFSLLLPVTAHAAKTIGANVDLLDVDHGIIIAHGTTDDKGEVIFRDLKPGKYAFVISGKSLQAFVHDWVPDDVLKTARPRSSSSSFGLGFGGFSGGGGGGGSKHASSQQGGGPVGGAPTKSSSDAPHSNEVSTSGDSGVSVNINQLAKDGDSGNGPSAPSDRVRLEAEIGWERHDATGDVPVAQGSKFSVDVPYCRDTAGQGMRIGFTVPEEVLSASIRGIGQDDVVLSISARGGD